MMNTENCKCRACLWADKCDFACASATGCDYYEPADEEEIAADEEENYRRYLTERQNTYMEIVSEQDE